MAEEMQSKPYALQASIHGAAMRGWVERRGLAYGDAAYVFLRGLPAAGRRPSSRDQAACATWRSRAGVCGGARAWSTRCVRIRSITGDSRIAAMIFICLRRFARCAESISKTRLSNRAPARRRTAALYQHPLLTSKSRSPIGVERRLMTKQTTFEHRARLARPGRPGRPSVSVHEREGDVTGTCLSKVLDSRRACTDRYELEVPLSFLRVLRKLQRRGHPIVGMRSKISVRKFEVRSGCHERIQVGGFERDVEQVISPQFSDSIVLDRLPIGQY